MRAAMLVFAQEILENGLSSDFVKKKNKKSIFSLESANISQSFYRQYSEEAQKFLVSFDEKKLLFFS